MRESISVKNRRLAAMASASTSLTGRPSAAAARTTSSYSGIALTSTPSWRASLTATVWPSTSTAAISRSRACLPRGSRAARWRRCAGRSPSRTTSARLARDQHREGVGRATLLHEDRREPGVAGAGLEQGGDHLRPDPRVEVVDVASRSAAAGRRPLQRRSRRAAAARWRGPPGRGPRPRRRSTRRSWPAAVPSSWRGWSAARHRSACTAPSRARRPVRRTTERRGAARRPPVAGPGACRGRRATTPEPTATGLTTTVVVGEGGEARADADDVGDRVERTDLVERDVERVAAVDGGLGDGEPLEDGGPRGRARRVEGGGEQQGADVAPGAVVDRVGDLDVAARRGEPAA